MADPGTRARACLEAFLNSNLFGMVVFISLLLDYY
jgi:hypothetical protein